MGATLTFPSLDARLSYTIPSPLMGEGKGEGEIKWRRKNNCSRLIYPALSKGGIYPRPSKRSGVYQAKKVA